MRLDILGCAGTYPLAGQPTSGYLLTSRGTDILCDAGFGTFAELTRRIEPDRLDAVVLSHRHPDHCADFLALHHALAYGPYEKRGLPVFCAPGLGSRLAEFMGAGEGHGFFEVFDFHEVGETNHVVVGAFDMRFAVTSHSVPTIATRFESGGRSLTYSADTGPGGGFPELSRGSNVMLCEASIEGERNDHHFVHHLTGREAGEIAREAGVEKLVLTHVPPSLDRAKVLAEAQAVFGGGVVLASPGDVYEV
jgi:ribonuclease BN (tRNA processing enzyme)